ncbi:unnamed protein product [Caenorhabditis sp. 36 PRJEB53466]|nr:unnamed protein product [Caenorhabditis sp. 36 PRJEB53466]
MTDSTFSYQNSLPSLPLPGLEDTIDKYLKALIPVISNEELTTVTDIAQKFANSQGGHKMQAFLETRSESLKNWLEDWWYDAYTTNRGTLLTQNMGAIIPKSFGPNSSQVGIAAQIIHHIMSYWNLVRQEKIEITKSRGTKWDMFQVYNLFNACRVPAKPKDKIERYFCTDWLQLMRPPQLANSIMDALKPAAQNALNTLGESLSIPFLDHPSFAASGGNGNFLLSTSFLGYNENGCFGYVLPMCKDGYGAFYRINTTSFTFTLSNFFDDATNGDEFRENLEYSLDFIKNVILTAE